MEQTVVIWALDEKDIKRVRNGELSSQTIWAESDLEGVAPPVYFYLGCGMLVWLAATGCIALPWMVNWGVWAGVGISVGTLIAVATAIVVIRRNTIRQARAEIKLRLPDRYRFALPKHDWPRGSMGLEDEWPQEFSVSLEAYSSWELEEHPRFAEYVRNAQLESRSLFFSVR